MDVFLRNFNYWIHLLFVAGILSPYPVSGNWMYLGVLSSVGFEEHHEHHDETCNQIPGLVFQQLEVCKNHPESLFCISEGARRGILECQNQFQNERWNCTTSSNYTVFGDVLKKGTRETAFIYAILSAGVVHATTQSCSLGNLTDCSCDMKGYGDKETEGWKWGGCSDNVNYGLWFSETFVDAPEKTQHEKSQSIRNTMNLHNNQVGRNVTETLMKVRCRCHGVSGSCGVKTCWRSLPTFYEIGAALKAKYEASVAIARRSKRRPRRREKSKRRVPIKRDDLVYVHKSPNYCRRNPAKGILGTSGRQCNKMSNGGDSCSLLCCGRGYNTQVVKYVQRCNCKFVWCCYVTCKTCEKIIEKHTCK